jgi:hypothetical protein
MGDVASILNTVADAATDPYLSEVICHVGQLKQIDHGQAVQVCDETPAGLTGGVGLRNAIIPLRWYVYAQQNKWVYPVALIAAIGIPMFIGYELGKD